jgi:hypothetical protein
MWSDAILDLPGNRILPVPPGAPVFRGSAGSGNRLRSGCDIADDYVLLVDIFL